MSKTANGELFGVHITIGATEVLNVLVDALIHVL